MRPEELSTELHIKRATGGAVPYKFRDLIREALPILRARIFLLCHSRL